MCTVWQKFFWPSPNGQFTSKPKKQNLKGFFPKKETCDVSLDPRPKQKSSGFQKKNQDLRGKRSYTQNYNFYRIELQAPPSMNYTREYQRSALSNLIVTFLSNKINQNDWTETTRTVETSND